VLESGGERFKEPVPWQIASNGACHFVGRSMSSGWPEGNLLGEDANRLEAALQCKANSQALSEDLAFSHLVSNNSNNNGSDSQCSGAHTWTSAADRRNRQAQEDRCEREQGTD